MQASLAKQWVADDNQISETAETPSLDLTNTQQHGQQYEQPLSPTKLQAVIPPKPIPVEAAVLQEVTCIEENSILLVMLVGRKLQMQGKLRVSNQRLMFFTMGKFQQEEPMVQIPIGYLSKCERLVDDKVTFLQIWVKYGCSFKLRCGEGKYEFSFKAYQIIQELIKNSVKLAIEFGSTVNKERLCHNFTLQQSAKECYEFENDGWKRFPNYPEKFFVPLNYLSKNNQDERLVVFAFKYKSAKEEITVWRTGPGRAEPTQDEWVAKSRHANSRLYTLQIKNKGIGSSKSLATRMIELQGIPLIKQAFGNLFRIAFNNHEPLKWLANFNQTRWLDQIATLLQQASALISRLNNEQTLMITIIADTDIRGAQLTALAQVLLFPEYRTLSGFSQLIERQFLQWGFPRSNKKQDPDKGTAIIQFLDAVFQLTCIYPLSFQFSQNALVFIAENVYTNKFGNFLLTSKAIREDERQIVRKCWSIWDCLRQWVKDEKTAHLYLNPFYVDFKQCDIYELKQFPSSKSLKIWNGFFFKRFKETNADYNIFHRYQKIYCQHFKNKKMTEQLRKQLSEQHKTLVERKQMLKDLKSLE